MGRFQTWQNVVSLSGGGGSAQGTRGQSAERDTACSHAAAGDRGGVAWTKRGGQGEAALCGRGGCCRSWGRWRGHKGGRRGGGVADARGGGALRRWTEDGGSGVRPAAGSTRLCP